MEENTIAFWFALKAVPGGRPVSYGPFINVKLANEVRVRNKGRHSEVSPWFVAESEQEADDIAKWQFEGGIHPRVQ